METATIIGIIGLIISAASFFTMLFGVRLGRKALAKSETLFGQEAEERYIKLKDTVPKDHLFGPYEYGGGNKATPQFEVEKITYNPLVMGPECKGFTSSVRYYYKDKDSGKIMVRGWRLKK